MIGIKSNIFIRCLDKINAQKENPIKNDFDQFKTRANPVNLSRTMEIIWKLNKIALFDFPIFIIFDFGHWLNPAEHCGE